MSPDEKVIYLDNAATTFPKPELVYQAMDEFYRNYGGNAGRGANPLARKAASLVEETRGLLREWLDSQEVVFTPSATIALNTVIQGARLRPGDVVYVTPFEHNSVLRPLEHIRQMKGIEIRVIPFDPSSFQCDLENTVELFQIEPPSMICATLMSNVFGIAPPLDEIISAAKAIDQSAICLVDGAQGAGLHGVDMAHVDALVFSGHKSLYGPFGIAGIAFGTSWRPEPLLFGGTGTYSESIGMPEEGASRFEAGSHNALSLSGLNASAKWTKGIGKEMMRQAVEGLCDYLIQSLSQLRGITMHPAIGPLRSTGIVSFSCEGTSPQAIESALGAYGIAVRAGLHCAPWAHEFAGTSGSQGTVRLSVGYFNSRNDIEELERSLARTLGEGLWTTT